MELKNLGLLLFLVSWALLAQCGTDAGSIPRRVKAAKPSQLNLVVGRGRRNIRTINEAIAVALYKTIRDKRKTVIKVKAGVYNENVIIDDRLPNLTLLGDGKGKTIITGNLSVGRSKLTTFKTATVAVDADGFTARGITFRNTAGSKGEQAVALRVSGDRAAFYECSFEGYQDTLYVHHGRQFYKQCDIYGSIDFIFGNAMAVFQDCNIYVRKPRSKTAVITASKREGPDDQTGIIIQKSRIAAAPGANLEGIRVYLGRPWGDYARTIVMESRLESLIDREGWLWWDGKDESIKNKIYYAEYKNTGAGSSTAGRVDWSKVNHAITQQEAEQFTVDKFLDGYSWLPSTNVPFTSGL